MFGGGPLVLTKKSKKNFEKQMTELNNFFEEARRYAQAKAAKQPGFQPNSET